MPRRRCNTRKRVAGERNPCQERRALGASGLHEGLPQSVQCDYTGTVAADTQYPHGN